MIGIKLTTLGALVLLAFPAAGWLRAEDRMHAGMWEITTSAGPKPITGNTCFTPAMVEFGNSSASALREAAEKSSAKKGCTLKDFKAGETSVSMIQICGAKSLTVLSTYAKTSFETVSTSTEAGVSRVLRMTGRRTGDCK